MSIIEVFKSVYQSYTPKGIVLSTEQEKLFKHSLSRVYKRMSEYHNSSQANKRLLIESIMNEVKFQLLPENLELMSTDLEPSEEINTHLAAAISNHLLIRSERFLQEL